MSKLFYKMHCRLFSFIGFILLCFFLFNNSLVAQPGSGQIYFKQIKYSDRQKGEIKISVYVMIDDTFILIDSLNINPKNKPLIALNKGKGEHKIIISFGSKTMKILFENLEWGTDYGLLNLELKEGVFQIIGKNLKNGKWNKICNCFDLSQKLTPK
ncbi:MAG TPA: hypothetical protein VNI52_13280 [Sphingobacteriaceae bacterium]|nr:hypothetical protein [Sphingobacteriaceae bacterium]